MPAESMTPDLVELTRSRFEATARVTTYADIDEAHAVAHRLTQERG